MHGTMNIFKKKAIGSAKDSLVLTDLHGVVSQKNGIYSSVALATPNLGQTQCLQNGAYSDRLLCSQWSELDIEPVVPVVMLKLRKKLNNFVLLNSVCTVSCRYSS